MPIREYSLDYVVGGEQLRIQGSFGPDTANPPTALKGRGFSAVRSSAGTFTVTLDMPFVDVVAFNATLQLNAADDKYCQCGAISVSARTFVIRVWDISGAAATDVAINANNRVNFAIVVRLSSWSLA